MTRLRPRSLSALALLGLAIITLPLIGALAWAGLQMRQMSERSASIVADAVAATRLTQELFSQGALLERQIRLYQVLETPQLLETYAAQDAKLREIEQGLTTQLPPGAARQSLALLTAQREQMTAEMLTPTGAARDFDRLLAGFSRMQTLAADVAELSNAHIETEIVSLRARTEHTQRLMFWGLVLLIPVTTIATLLLSLRVGRPLRQVDRAISELGSGALHSPIHVRGPADIEKLGRQLEWLRLRLLELAQERNRFLRHMSHELKTPLANIREGTELLMDGAVGELQNGQREVTGILRENGLKLQRMIENLLSFSAWQTSSVGIEVSEFRLRPVVKQIIENQQLALLAQRVRLDVSVEDLSIAGDRGKIRLILENLLSNAIKYTPRSGTIHIRARADSGDLVLEVADSGPGIPSEERKQVFEAFYTGKAPAGHIKGTGIGLSVVMEFVNAHGGKIEIIDGQWPGAHFRIRMPLKTARTSPPQAAAHAA
jgi:two-component system sensor histidine kinase GlrK